MMVCRRVFIIHLHTTRNLDEYLLRVIARTITSALLLSYSIRRSTCICIETPLKKFIVIGSEVKRLYADDDSSVGIVRKVLVKGGKHSGIYTVSSCSEVTCKLLYNIKELLKSSERLRSIEYPLCIYVPITLRGEKYVVKDLDLEPWNAVVIANIVLDNIGVES